ncbi:hypothetical protein ADUPG1_008871 [Aduncisulcus paluster]|uniref:RING-type E3 ubiquitin transferase n=1 Tax=Aduncisulcus paluster TaxID=2918883 RepID=A0ABQ5KTJ8_9EUKA|nr:hypothetical protein ADUPG1_008871 [Aduncisulcus paluster]
MSDYEPYSPKEEVNGTFSFSWDDSTTQIDTCLPTLTKSEGLGTFYAYDTTLYPDSTTIGSTDDNILYPDEEDTLAIYFLFRNGRYINESTYALYGVGRHFTNTNRVAFQLSQARTVTEIIQNFTLDCQDAGVDETAEWPPAGVFDDVPTEPTVDDEYKCTYDFYGTIDMETVNYPPKIPDLTPLPDMDPDVTTVSSPTIKGSLVSKECAFLMGVDSGYYDTRYGAVGTLYFGGVALLLSILSAAFLVAQNAFASTQSKAQRLSLVWLGSYVFYEALFAFIVMGVAMDSIDLASVAIVAAVVHIMSCTILGSHCVISTRTSLAPREVQENDVQMRRWISNAQWGLYGPILAMLVLWAFLSFRMIYPLLIVAATGAWFQVIHSFQRKQSVASPWYVYWGLWLIHIVPAAYFCLYDNNILSMKPNPILFWVYIGYSFLPVFIMQIQSWFAEKLFKSTSTHNYFAPLTVTQHPIEGETTHAHEDGEGSEEEGPRCAICLVNVRSGDHMITPCNHVFHKECLTRWMDISLTCPTCRAEIPPLVQ